MTFLTRPGWAVRFAAGMRPLPAVARELAHARDLTDLDEPFVEDGESPVEMERWYLCSEILAAAARDRGVI